ncbi:MAG TPA: hypothetical protein VE172_09695 [Stackebrandtia sp.]|uniref:MarR family winged helix-turn-helix transcriptional regulator n=1 Tax=Stackebrandtia sp. TaxID=2023065 RepID=UPI002D646C8F|nr:hypothetical protein [Stackebrandtia sp.]HZE39069.1 hypothetical protein [Stackebrandtia sp.]
MSTPKPMGYWLKHIDRGLENNFAALLETEGLNRRRWQILNTVATDAVDADALDAALRPFLTEAEPTVRPQLDALVAQGWIALGDNDSLTLTDDGRAAYERVNARVQRLRAEVIDGLSPEDYRALVEMLRRIASNVDAQAVALS